MTGKNRNRINHWRSSVRLFLSRRSERQRVAGEGTLIPWKKIAVLILIPAFLFACILPFSATGTSAPPTSQSITSGTPQNSGATIAPAQLTGKKSQIMITEGTTKRTAWFYTPASYAKATSVSLIVMFHGIGGDAAKEIDDSELSALSDTDGFLVAYPQATGSDRKWDEDPGSADVSFIRDLVQKIETDYPKVDTKRIYATGMSNGGGEANRMGCDLADIFAAIAPVEGGYTAPAWQTCALSPSHSFMPVMAFHGYTDPVVPYGGGNGTGPATLGVFPPIQDWIQAWAKRDGCNVAQPTETNPTPQPGQPKVTLQEWTGCAGNAVVILYTVNPHGHAWYNGDPLDAGELMWQFFQAHPMP